MGEFNDYCQHCVEQVIQHIAAGSLVEKRYMKQNRRCSARLTFNIELNAQQMFRMRSWTGRPVLRRECLLLSLSDPFPISEPFFILHFLRVFESDFRVICTVCVW